jgi:hypothetical protein
MSEMDLKEYTRKEKIAWLKEREVSAHGKMKTDQLNELIREYEAFERGERETAPTGSKKPARKRVPLGRFRRRLSTEHLNIPERYVQRWVNDEPGRIAQAIEGGYQLVQNPNSEEAGEKSLTTDSMGNSINAFVGEDNQGKPQKAYLMIIDKDLYDEDQQDKQRDLDRLQTAIERGADEDEGQYVPDKGKGIKLVQERGGHTH